MPTAFGYRAVVPAEEEAHAVANALLFQLGDDLVNGVIAVTEIAARMKLMLGGAAKASSNLFTATRRTSPDPNFFPIAACRMPGGWWCCRGGIESPKIADGSHGTPSRR